MNALESTLRWIAIAGVFCLPFIALLISTSLFFPFITGKNFAFRIIVEIMAGAWLALAIMNPAYRPRRSWVLGALALFVAVMALANALGEMPFKSFWSNFERMDGWVSLAHLLLYTVVAASVMTTERLWRWLMWTTLGVSVAMAWYAIFQALGIATIVEGFSSIQRVDARMGNPIYLAVYMLFHIFIAAMLWAEAWKEYAERAKRVWISCAYGAVILFNTLALLMTGTRGTMLGLIGGVVLATALIALFERERTGARKIAAGMLALIVLMGGAFWLVRDAAWVQNVGFLQRLATISLTENTISARFINWSIAWEGVQERPLLGWGQENYAVVFNKYYDPRMHGQEPWFDRVHNSIFDWLIAGGFLGLLTYLSIFLAALWALWLSRAFAVMEAAILTGMLAGYFVHNLAVFDNVTSYILFGTMLAYITWRAAAHTGAKPIYKKVLVPATSAVYVAIVIALLTWAVAWWVNAGALAQNRTLLQAVAPQQAGLARNLELFEEALGYGHLGTQEAREHLAQTAAYVAGTDAPAEIKQQFLQLAIRELEAQAAASPLDARPVLFIGVVHRAFGDYDAAMAALERAHALSPSKQSILFELGQTALVAGDGEASLDYFRRAWELGPDVRDSRIFYAAVAIRTGQDALGEELLQPLIASGEAADQRILGAYVVREQYDRIIPIWRARIDANPNSMEDYGTLAALYYRAGDRDAAAAVLEEAIAQNPASAQQFAPLIEQVRAGTANL